MFSQKRWVYAYCRSQVYLDCACVPPTYVEQHGGAQAGSYFSEWLANTSNQTAVYGKCVDSCEQSSIIFLVLCALELYSISRLLLLLLPLFFFLLYCAHSYLLTRHTLIFFLVSSRLMCSVRHHLLHCDPANAGNSTHFAVSEVSEFSTVLYCNSILSSALFTLLCSTVL